MTIFAHCSRASLQAKWLSDAPGDPPRDWGALSRARRPTRLALAAEPVHSRTRASRAKENVEERFRALKDQWEAETSHLSALTKIVMHPAYQQIIGLGEPAVPLLLRELAREPNQWFWALRAVTGENPVPDEMRGRVEEMARAWLDWARKRGIR